MPDRPLIHRGTDGVLRLVARAPWVAEVVRYVRAGGKVVLLDATMDVGELRSLGLGRESRVPGARSVPMIVEEVHVEDAPGVERVFLRWSSAARGKHVRADGTVDWRNTRGVLREIASVVTKVGGPLGLIALKPTANALMAEWNTCKTNSNYSGPLPREFADLARSGIELRAGWFGNHRGSDAWKGVRVHVVLGDPYPPVGDVEATAALLGRRHVFPTLRRRAQAEIQQAIARARPVWLESTLVHAGNFAPDLLLAPQWGKGARRAAKSGRPATHSGEEWVEHERRRARLGASKRQYAEAHGIPVATYMRNTKQVLAEAKIAPLPAPPDDDSPASFLANMDPEVRDGVRANLLLSVVERALTTLRTHTEVSIGCLQVGSQLVITAGHINVAIMCAALEDLPFAVPGGRIEALLSWLRGCRRFVTVDGERALTDGATRFEVEAPTHGSHRVARIEFALDRAKWRRLRRVVGVTGEVCMVHDAEAGLVILRPATSRAPLRHDDDEIACPTESEASSSAVAVATLALDSIVGRGDGPARLQLGPTEVWKERSLALDTDGLPARRGTSPRWRCIVRVAADGREMPVPATAESDLAALRTQRTAFDLMSELPQE